MQLAMDLSNPNKEWLLGLLRALVWQIGLLANVSLPAPTTITVLFVANLLVSTPAYSLYTIVSSTHYQASHNST